MSEDAWSNDPDQWDDRRNPDQLQKKGMSTGSKILIGCLSLTGISLMLCCGGIGYLLYQVQQGRVTDPAAIRDMTGDIVQIDIPEGYEPLEGVKIENLIGQFVPNFRLVSYRDKEGEGVLVVVELEGVGEGEQEDAQIKQAMDQQAQRRRELEDLEVVEQRAYQIGDQKVLFDFAKGTDKETGEAFRLVSGTFRDGSDAISIMLQIPEDEYNEEQVDQVLKSLQPK